MITDMPIHPKIASGWGGGVVAVENPWISHTPSPYLYFGHVRSPFPDRVFCQEVCVFIEDGAEWITSCLRSLEGGGRT